MEERQSLYCKVLGMIKENKVQSLDACFHFFDFSVSQARYIIRIIKLFTDNYTDSGAQPRYIELACPEEKSRDMYFSNQLSLENKVHSWSNCSSANNILLDVQKYFNLLGLPLLSIFLKEYTLFFLLF